MGFQGEREQQQQQQQHDLVDNQLFFQLFFFTSSCVFVGERNWLGPDLILYTLSSFTFSNSSVLNPLPPPPPSPLLPSSNEVVVTSTRGCCCWLHYISHQYISVVILFFSLHSRLSCISELTRRYLKDGEAWSRMKEFHCRVWQQWTGCSNNWMFVVVVAFFFDDDVFFILPA